MSIDYSNYTITPTTLADIKGFFPSLTPFRVKALTVKVEGKIYGIGGYLLAPDGTKIMFLEAEEKHCKFMPSILYRATLQVMDDLKKSGAKRVIARLDKTRDKAEKFLLHLGFTRLCEKDGEVIYQWQQSPESPRSSVPLAL